MPAWYFERPLSPPAPRPLPLPARGGDRNALRLYRVANLKVDYRFVPKMPLRVSALRSPGAHLNVFAIESFMDELARRQARPRRVQAPASGRSPRRRRHPFGGGALRVEEYRGLAGGGKGFAFARCKNLAAYLAIAVEVSVDHGEPMPRVLRAVAAVDSGVAVNPDGIRNQIEGGIIQASSWTLLESVTFGRTLFTSRDWASYPILRFSARPRSMDVVAFNRPGQPFLGTGEAAQGPAAAALANALADATGLRLRDLPLGGDRIMGAMSS